MSALASKKSEGELASAAIETAAFLARAEAGKKPPQVDVSKLPQFRYSKIQVGTSNSVTGLFEREHEFGQKYRYDGMYR